jgi:hypothetical protein
MILANVNIKLYFVNLKGAHYLDEQINDQGCHDKKNGKRDD